MPVTVAVLQLPAFRDRQVEEIKPQQNQRTEHKETYKTYIVQLLNPRQQASTGRLSGDFLYIFVIYRKTSIDHAGAPGGIIPLKQ